MQNNGLRLWAALGLVLLWGCGPGPDGNANGNSNSNSNGNGNDNGGTGNTVDDLPDLSADDAFGTGEGPDSQILGLILVGYDSQVSDMLFAQLVDSTATALGAEVQDVISDIRVASFRVDPGGEDAAMALVEQLGDVAYAEIDVAGELAGVEEFIPEAASAEFAQYQLFSTNALRAREVVSLGSGDVTVAVLDSGCFLAHQEFATSDVITGTNTADGGTNISDLLGHGTAVVSLLAASTNGGQMAGLLPGFGVSVYKVADSGGFVRLDAAVTAIIGAINGDGDGDLTTAEIPPADVLYLGFSFSTDSQSLARAIFEANSRGVIVVAAAGNNGRSDQARDARFPAGYSTVISVGATDIRDHAAPFSNRAASIDLAAPGVDLLVAVSGGTHAFADGTSYAGVQVAAAAAWLLEREGPLTTTQVRERLTSRGDPLPADSGFGGSLRRLNLSAALRDAIDPPCPYLIPDPRLVTNTGVSRPTLVSEQAGMSSLGATPEAFSEELTYWYGYFPAGPVTFELLDGDQVRPVTPQSVVPSSMDQFLTFLRGIDLGTLQSFFGILQQAILEVPELGGQRRTVHLRAVVGGLASETRPLIYNPLQRGYNVVAYKNFDSVQWHFLEAEGEAFDPGDADVRLLGSGPRPEIAWSPADPATRVQVGSGLSPDYYVVESGADTAIEPPVGVGACVGGEVPEQLCGSAIVLPENQITRILVELVDEAASRFAAVDVIYVP